MNLDHALTKAQIDVPNCLGVAYVHLEDNQTLGNIIAQGCNDHLWDLVKTPSTLMQVPALETLETILNEPEVAQEFQEVLIYSNDHLYLMVRRRDQMDRAAVFICEPHTNLGMIYATARAATDTLNSLWHQSLSA